MTLLAATVLSTFIAAPVPKADPLQQAADGSNTGLLVLERVKK